GGDEGGGDGGGGGGGGGDGIHVVRAARAGIDPTRHAVLQAHRRAFLAAAGMGVDVDQARHYELAARVDRVGRAFGDVRGDGCDLAGADSDIADSINADGGIDYTTALD